MMDAKRVIDKYKAEAEVEQKTQEALRQEIGQLKAQGGGGGGGGGWRVGARGSLSCRRHNNLDHHGIEYQGWMSINPKP